MKNSRFEQFKTLLRNELGDKAELGEAGSVIIHANEFSLLRRFHSLQAAIDNFARHLPTNFVNPA